MRYLILFILFSATVTTSTLLTGCDSPMEVNRPGDNLSGYVSQFDTNIARSQHGFYSISIYSADSSNPFNRVPLRSDSLNITKRHDNYCYESLFDISGVPSGNYHVAVTWSRYPRIPNEKPKVLGTYGCDTNFVCTAHKIVKYPNYDGNFRNITSHSDTLRAMF